MTQTHQLLLELTVVLAYACTVWSLLALRQEHQLRINAEAHLDDLLNDYEDHTDNVLSALRDITPDTFRAAYDWESE